MLEDQIRNAGRATKARLAAPAFRARHLRDMRTYDRFRDLTMVPPHWFVDNLELAREWRNVPGDIVECGTWRGGMSAALSIAAPGHHSVLFDSFEGLPDAKPIDGESAVHWSTEVRDYENCSADESFAHTAMKRANSESYEVVKGWFDQTVPEWAAPGRPIAILRLDGDWYDSTMVCLEHLFPLVSPKGGIIIDDYFVWDGCARAVHEYLLKIDSRERIRSTAHDVAYIRRGSAGLRSFSGAG